MAVVLQIGLGATPKSSLVTCKRLSEPGLHSIPGQEEPGVHGSGLEDRQSLSEDIASITWNKVSLSWGSRAVECRTVVEKEMYGREK